VPNASTATLTVSGTAELKVTSNIDTGSVITSSINVSGGTLSASGLVNGSGGSAGESRNITISGGTLTVGSVNFGNNASTLIRNFTESAGTVMVNNAANAGTINAGQNSVWDINGGTFTVTGTMTTQANSTVSFTGAQTHVSLGNLALGATTLNLGATDVTMNSATFGSGGVVNVTVPLSLNANIIFGNASVSVDPNVTFALTGPISTTTARTLTKLGNGTLTVSGAQTHILGSAYQTNAGVLNLASNAGPNIKVTASGGTTNFTAQQMVGSITINAGGLVALAATPGTTHSAGTMTIAGGTVPTGTLDVGSNHFVLNYTGATPFTTIQAQVKSGFHGGDWNGPGIRSSSASFSGAHPTGVGYAEASAVGLTGGFNGVTTDPDTIILRFTYAGDANLDGTASTNDFTRLGQNFGSTAAAWSQGDFNYDGTVNALDFNLLSTNYGQTGPSALGTLVPEPAEVGALAIVALLARRRRMK
jgi:hypothetical protein